MFPESRGISLICRFVGNSVDMLIVRRCYRATIYKNMRKWMIEFIRTFENRGFKIARVNTILITKSINLQLFTLILCGVGGPL